MAKAKKKKGKGKKKAAARTVRRSRRTARRSSGGVVVVSNPPTARKRRVGKRRRARNPPKMKLASAAMEAGKAAIGGVAAVGLTGLAQQLSPSLTVDRVLSVLVPLAVAGAALMAGQPAAAAGAAGVAGASVMSLVSESIQRAPLSAPTSATTQSVQQTAANPPISLEQRRALIRGTQATPLGAAPLRAGYAR